MTGETGHHGRVLATSSRRRRLAGVCALGIAGALAVSACDPSQPTPAPSTGTPSPTPYPQATLDPSSIDLLHLADEPPPPADHLEPGAHGLTEDYTDPHGVFTEKMPPGPVSVLTNSIIDTGGYRAPVTVYTPQKTPTSPSNQPEIDTFTVTDLQTNLNVKDIERRVVAWESQRMAQLPGLASAPVGLVGQRTGKFRELPAMVFKLRAGSTQLKVLTLVIGHTVYTISMVGTDDPPASFDAFAVSFQLITNPSPEPSPTLPPPPATSPTTSPTPSGGASPSGGVTPTPGGESPGPGGGTPPPV
jgi:hypothetical protein